jgi:predicted negative regulator of RcsB-dependent stress response
MSKENKEKMASVLADGALAASTGKLTQEKREELIAQLASIIAGEKEVNTTHKEIAAKILEAHANKAVETTLWGIAKARLAAMPLSAKIILAVVAAIAAVIAIFSALHTS